MPVAVIAAEDGGVGGACAAALRARAVQVAATGPRAMAGAELSLELDLLDVDAVAAAVGRIESELGPIDYLVTVSGRREPGEPADLTEAAWREALDAHLWTTVNVLRAVLPGMRSRRRGAVCAIGSELALRGDPYAPHYAAAAGAVHTLVKSLAVEAAPDGVRVNCVAPNPTRTSLEWLAAVVCFALLEDTNLLGQVIATGGLE